VNKNVSVPDGCAGCTLSALHPFDWPRDGLVRVPHGPLSSGVADTLS
jgi:hypothetical protein